MNRQAKDAHKQEVMNQIKHKLAKLQKQKDQRRKQEQALF